MRFHIKILPFLLLFPLMAGAQEESKLWKPGRFGLGVRADYNFFPGENSFHGFGSGGLWKLGFAKMVNTEWFADYIQSNDGLFGSRDDIHIGWSVQFTPFKKGFGHKFTPYFLGGQCFDLTKVRVTVPAVRSFSALPYQAATPYQFSAAVQTGLGFSSFIEKDLELTAEIQYMIHLGKDVHIDYEPMNVDALPVLNVENTTRPDGHLILNVSVTYYFLNLWK